jgi:integrase
MRTWGNPLRPGAFYTIILILYAAGLRIGEALRLRIHLLFR